jgi:hypothetical protein
MVNRTLHYEAGRESSRVHFLMGIPTITLSTAIGTIGFVGVFGPPPLWLPGVTAVLGMATTILTALFTFLHPGAKAYAHRRAGVRFGNVARDIEALLAIPSAARGDVTDVIERFAQRLSSAAEEAPEVTGKLLEKFKTRAPLLPDDPRGAIEEAT